MTQQLRAALLENPGSVHCTYLCGSHKSVHNFSSRESDVLGLQDSSLMQAKHPYT